MTSMVRSQNHEISTDPDPKTAFSVIFTYIYVCSRGHRFGQIFFKMAWIIRWVQSLNVDLRFMLGRSGPKIMVFWPEEIVLEPFPLCGLFLTKSDKNCVARLVLLKQKYDSDGLSLLPNADFTSIKLDIPF